MKKRSFTLFGMALLGVLIGFPMFAQQQVNMPLNTGAQTVTVPAGGYVCFFDNGGPAGAYSNSSNPNTSLVTFAPTTPGAKLRTTFTAFSTEASWDALYAYDGNSLNVATIIPSGNGVPIGAAGPANGWWGGIAPNNAGANNVVATAGNASGALTYAFASDGSVTLAGWSAIVIQDGGALPSLAGCTFTSLPLAPLAQATQPGALTCAGTFTIALPAVSSPSCLAGLRYRINGGQPIAVPAGATNIVVTLPLGANIITWEIGFCSVVATANQTVTVTDGTPPVIVCPASSTINLAPGLCDAVVSYNVTATDNCPTDVVFSAWPNPDAVAIDVNSLSCGPGAVVNNYFQVVGTTFGATTPNFVRVGIATTWPGGSSANTTLTARIYRLNNPAQPFNVSLANRTLLATSLPFTVPAGSAGQRRNIPFPAGISIPAGTTMLLEVQSSAAFCVATPINPALTSWLGATACGIDPNNPPTFTAIGFPGLNMLASLNASVPLTTVQTAGLPSGSAFPIGTTVNIWRATDGAGNSATCSFSVTVLEFPNPISSLACNDFIQISVDENCTAVIGADQILEGGPYRCYDNYIVQLDKTAPFGNGPWVPAIVGPSDIGKTYTVRVTDPVNGNMCWGNVKIEDKIKPVLDCPGADVPCNADYSPGANTALNTVTIASPSLTIVNPGVANLSFPVNLPAGTQIVGFTVRFQTNHTWVGDIDARLTGANGQISQLFDRPGVPATGLGCPNNGMDVLFSDGAAGTPAQLDAQCNAAPPAVVGSYQAINPINPLATGTINGNWNLRIQDFDFGDGGTATVELIFDILEPVPFPNGLVQGVNVFPTSTAGCYTVTAGAGDPVMEFCSATSLCFLDVINNQACATGLTQIVSRKWTAVDASGNSRTCVQTINLVRPTLGDITLPPNYDNIDAPALECNSSYPTPDFLESIGLQGYPYFFGNPDGCSIGCTWEDNVLDICDGTYKIARHWECIDWCTSQIAEHTQIIKVLDDEGPVFQCPANITVSTDPFQCCATTNLPDVIVEDACSRINNLSGMIIGIDPFTGDTIGMFPIGGTLTSFPGNNAWDLDTLANFGNTPCLPIGTHTVIYVAEDDCGNSSTCSFRLTIRDFTPPNVACDEFTVVSIGIDDPADCYEPSADGCQFAGVTWVKATTFDDGSYDNCGNIDFKVQRMQPFSSCILGLNQINGQPACDDIFPDFPSEFERAISEGDSIKFYCCEVGTTQTVILRVYQLDVNGNFAIGQDGTPIFNECMVEVSVQDKLKPVCQAPANVTVSCENFDPSLWAYGNATVFDNCCLDSTVSYLGQKGLSNTTVLTNFDTTCNKGTITRRWTARDCNGLTSTCTQRVVVQYEQDYFVRFPNDKILFACDSSFFDQPTFFGEDCELLAVSYSDNLFTVVPDACYKIERTWTIINWCTYNPNLGCIFVPNPNPNVNVNSPQNLPGPVVSRCGTTGVWAPTVVRINPTDPTTTNFCTFWDANANCYQYKQIIKVIDNEDPIVTNCPASPVEICDLTPNDPLFWNDMAWWDNTIGSHDLCEAPTDLTITATDACAGENVNFRYLLFLDLDQSGDMETVISSTNLPNFNTVLFNNANTANYTGGVARPFDQRPVGGNQKFGFALQQTANAAAGTKTAAVRWNTFQSPNNFVVPQLPYGTHKIKWFIEDGCGNETICEYVFIVKDCKAPTVVCINGLSVNIMPTQMISLWASDFLQYTEDNCTPTDQIKIGIRRKGTGTGFPTNPDGSPQTVVNFTCADLGTQFVELWGEDAAGNADYCETYVIVQDNGGFCSNSAVTVAGALQTATQQGLEEAEVELNGSHPALPTINMFDMSNNDGTYLFGGAVPVAGTYTVTPMKDDDHLNGVSTFDLVLINKHILGIETLDSPYKMIAADANNSKSITTFDIAELRKLILGIYTELPNNTSWRFVDAAYNFPNTQNPFTPAFPESKSVADVQASQLEDNFVSMKVGDVNGSAIANSFMSTDDRTAGTLLFDVEDRQVKAGEEVVVNFKASEKVNGYQFTMNFAGMEVVDVVPGADMTLANFGVFADAITTSFDADVTGEFTVKFRATQAGNLSNMLGISSRVTKAEAYSKGGDRLNVAFRFNGTNGATIAGVGFELYQNMPNPFVSKTVIGFHLPEAAKATLTIFDEAGRMIYTMKGDFAKGNNAVSLDRAQINTTGVLYYKLETANDSATKKMIQAR